MIRKNMKLIIGFVIGLLITTGGVYAANSLSAASISVSKTNMSKVPQENLQSALDYLYSQLEKTNMITIESGVKHDYQTYLGIAYLDPTNLERKCSEADEKLNRNQDGTITGVKTGCMKWYIYREDSNNYYAILDHNTTSNVAYNSDEVNTSQKEVATALASDTAGWISSLNSRLITAQEVADIVGINWNSENATESNWFYLDSKNKTNYLNYQSGSNFAWLFNNLGIENQPCTDYGCSYTDNLHGAGYWTSTPVTGSTGFVWDVTRLGHFRYYGASNSSSGIRPVITISKSLFN